MKTKSTAILCRCAESVAGSLHRQLTMALLALTFIAMGYAFALEDEDHVVSSESAPTPAVTDAAKASLERIRTLARHGDATNAIHLLSRLLDLNANSSQALFDNHTLFELGKTAWELGFGYEAQSALVLALASAEVNRDALSSHDAATAGKILDEIYDDGKTLRIMEEKNDPIAMERFLSIRIERHPRDAIARGLRGIARKEQGRLDDALEDLAEAQILGLKDLALRPVVQKARIDLERFASSAKRHGRDAASDFLYLGMREKMQEFDARKDWDGLDAYLGELMRRRSIHPFAAAQRAYLRIARGDWEGAEKYLAAALESADANAETRADVERGRALVDELGRKQGRGAAGGVSSGLARIASDPALMRSIPSAPWSGPTVKMELAQRLLDEKDFPALHIVLEQLGNMILTDSETGGYLTLAGDALLEEGRGDEAAERFHAALELPISDIRQARIHLRLAQIYQQEGKRDLALEHARRSIALTRQQPWAQIRIGRFFVSIEAYDEGIGHFQKAAELSSSPVEKCEAIQNIMTVYRNMGDQDKFIETAEWYIATAGLVPQPLPDNLAGMAEFYQGEIHQARNELNDAYVYFERASRRIVSPDLRAKVLMNLAEMDVQRGDADKAAVHARESAALLPDQPWKNRQVASFLRRLGKEDMAGELVENASWESGRERTLRTLANRAELARMDGNSETYLENARLYIQAADSGEQELLPEDRALVEFYRAELDNARGETDKAYANYEEAARLLTNRYQLSDIYMRLAQIDAKRGRDDQAVGHAVRSAGYLPDQAWRLREVGAFLLERERIGEAEEYLGKAAAATRQAAERADVYLTLANAFRDRGDREKFMQYARMHSDALSSGAMATAQEDEEGNKAFYEGEFLAAQGNDAEAYKAYDRAAQLLTDENRLAETLMKLAECEARRGRRSAAAAYAERSAALLPEEEWKLREVGGFLLRLGYLDKAAEYYGRLVAAAPSGFPRTASYYDTLAQAYIRAGDKDEYFRHAALYRDAMATEGYVPSDDEKGLAAFYNAELLARDGETDSAAREYDSAAQLLTNKFRLAETYMKLAVYSREKGDIRLAVEQAERSAALLPEQAWKLLEVGTFMLESDLPDAAMPYYKRWFALLPVADREPALLFPLAEAFQRRGETDKAFDVIRFFMKTDNAAAISEENAEALLAYYQARLYESQGDFGAAFPAYEQAARLFKSPGRLADARLKMAECQVRLGNREQGALYAGQAAEALPDDPEVNRKTGAFFLRLGDMELARTYMDRFLALSPPSPEQAAVLADMADGYRKKGDFARYAETIDRYGDSITSNGREPSREESGRLSLFRADMHSEQGDFTAAYLAYEEGLKFVENRFQLADIHFRMATILADRGDRDKAMEHMERSVSYLPAAPWKLLQAGDFYGRLKMTDKRLSYYRRALNNAPTPETKAICHAALAGAYRELDDSDKFLEHARHYVAIQAERGKDLEDPERGLAHYYQAMIHATENNAEAAASEYEKAARFLVDENRLADALYQLALYNADRGDTEKSAECMERSVAALPNQLWKRRQAAGLYARLGLTEKAAASYGRALELAETPSARASVHADFAELYRSAGDRDRYLYHAEWYVAEIGKMDAADRSDEELGNREYYRGEIAFAAGDQENAIRAYEDALEHTLGAARRVDLHLKIAEYHAKEDTEAAKDRIAVQVEKALAVTPRRSDVLRRVAALYHGMKRYDLETRYYEEALELAPTYREKALIISAMADTCQTRKDDDCYLVHAREYVRTAALQAAGGEEADAEEKGLAHFYKAEIHLAEGNPDAAHRQFEQASRLITKAPRLSDTLYRMARYLADGGYQTSAVEVMERSVALLPDAPWKHRQAGGLYAGLKLTEKAADSYKRFLALAGTTWDKASAHMDLAELYRTAGNQEEYLLHAKGSLTELAKLTGDEFTSERFGLKNYYWAELLVAEEKIEHAIYAYEQAVDHIESTARRLDLHLKIAEYYADKKVEAGVFFRVEKALAVEPARMGTLRRIASIFNSAKRYDLEERYYLRALELAPSFHEKMPIIASMASSFKARKDEKRYLAKAMEYLQTIRQNWAEATSDERGTSEYYRGEILSARKLPDQAYAAYENATRLLENRSTLSESYLKMARHNLNRGNKALAANHAELGAAAEPDKSYRVSEAARILMELRHYEEAAAILQRAIDMDPHGTKYLLGNDYLTKYLAQAYVEGIDKQTGLAINAAYIDRLVERIEKADPADNGKFFDEWWDTRWRQTRWRKNWGSFEHRLFGSRDAAGNFSLATYTELVFNLRFKNGFRAKAYGEIGWTYKSRYSGISQNASTGQWHPWESSSDIADTFYALVGFRFNPIRKLPPLDIRAEQVFGVGRERDNEFRLRIKWDRSKGLHPEFKRNFWEYSKEEADLTYSVTKRDFTSEGSIRRGVATSPCWDRNLVVAPYMAVRYAYKGKTSSDRWGGSFGPGIVMRKFFWEDKHHAPRAHVEFDLNYRIGFVRNQKNSINFSMTFRY